MATPTNPNLIQFSLQIQLIEVLKSYAKENESANLVAKRLLTELLTDSPVTESDSDDSPCELSEIKKQLADHETRLQALENPDHPIAHFLTKSSKED